MFDRSLLAAVRLYSRLRKKLKGIDNPHYSKMYLKSRQLKRSIEGRKFSFVTIDQASLWTAQWVKTFPRQYDLVVAVPRSGMLIASIIALKLGKGLTTPEFLRDGKFWHSSSVKEKLSMDDFKHVILVDDSADTGRAMSKAVDQIQSIGRNLEVTRASLIVHKETVPKVDLYHQVIEHPRVYEWNILHRKIASYWGYGLLAVDMDGVLCGECPPGVDDHEDLYLDWIKTAKPFLIPAFEIDAIVTNRLEKYRGETEQWLRTQNVKYKTLHMWDLPDKSKRNGGFARQKINQLLKLKPDMYWESSWWQAQEIWVETKIPTLCIDEMKLLC